MSSNRGVKVKRKNRNKVKNPNRRNSLNSSKTRNRSLNFLNLILV